MEEKQPPGLFASEAGFINGKAARERVHRAVWPGICPHSGGWGGAAGRREAVCPCRSLRMKLGPCGCLPDGSQTSLPGSLPPAASPRQSPFCTRHRSGCGRCLAPPGRCPQHGLAPPQVTPLVLAPCPPRAQLCQVDVRRCGQVRTTHRLPRSHCAA